MPVCEASCFMSRCRAPRWNAASSTALGAGDLFLVSAIPRARPTGLGDES